MRTTAGRGAPIRSTAGRGTITSGLRAPLGVSHCYAWQWTGEVVKEQLMMMKEFKSSFVSAYNKDGEEDGRGEKEYDATVFEMLDQQPIMKKHQAQGP